MILELLIHGCKTKMALLSDIVYNLLSIAKILNIANNFFGSVS